MWGSVAVHDQEGGGRGNGAAKRKGVEGCGNGAVLHQPGGERDNEAAEEGEGEGGLR